MNLPIGADLWSASGNTLPINNGIGLTQMLLIPTKSIHNINVNFQCIDPEKAINPFVLFP
jgi:hypothetical protein